MFKNRHLKIALVVLTAQATLQSSAQAGVQTFNLEKGKVKIEVPSEWQEAPELFGLPLVLLGPDEKGNRPVISVTPFAVSGVSFDPAGLKREEKTYKKGREEWLKSVDGKAVSFGSYKEVKLPNASEAHSIGFRYKLNGTEFAENTYYVVCGSQLFHIKTLMTSRNETKNSKTVEKILASFSCT